MPLTFNSVNAGAEEAQRLAADIVVMLGDLRRLSEGDLPVRHQQGLKERIEGVLAYMPLAVRSAESNFPDLNHFQKIQPNVYEILGQPVTSMQ